MAENAAATKVQALQRGRSQRQQMAVAANKASKERRSAIYGAPTAVNAVALLKSVEKTPETRKALETALMAHYLFKAVGKTSLDAVIDVMSKRNFAPGDIILRQGQQHGTFYVIEKGSVDTLVDGSNVGVIKGPYAFGELGLLTNGSSPATIQSTAGVYSSFWMIDREAFRCAMSAANNISAESKETAVRQRKMGTKPANRGQDLFAGKTGILLGCAVMRTIGTGTFGRVKLVQESTTKKIMALKCMQKARIFAKNQVANAIAERTALSEIDHPFVPKLFGTWQDSDQLYLFMEPVQGGDLWSLLYKKDVLPCTHLLGLEENVARAYAAMVIEALTEIHDMGYTYRGLKPEDLLLDAEGYLNVIDFGFAKKIPDGAKSNTLCGTLEYLAPEMVLAKGHNRAIDYWAFGIFVYELICGKTPFVDEHASKVCMKIVYSKRCLSLPHDISRDLRGLLNALLNPDPATRLGMARGGDQCVKAHPWFLDVDFSKLARKKYFTPYRPEVSSELDYSHYETVQGDEEVVPFNADLLASMGHAGKGVEFLQDLFVGF